MDISNYKAAVYFVKKTTYFSGREALGFPLAVVAAAAPSVSVASPSAPFSASPLAAAPFVAAPLDAAVAVPLTATAV